MGISLGLNDGIKKVLSEIPTKISNIRLYQLGDDRVNMLKGALFVTASNVEGFHAVGIADRSLEDSISVLLLKVTEGLLE